MDRTIEHSHLSGGVTIPSSKSLNHRAIIAASLSPGKSILKNVYISEDILATIEAMRALKAKIEINKNTLIVNGIDIHSLQFDETVHIHCNESGSTLRFIIPILSVIRGKFKLTGDGVLLQRPLDPYKKIFEKQGIRHTFSDSYVYIDTYENTLQPGYFELPGDVSSQFITGLLFSLPLLNQSSHIHITSPLESTGYIDLTTDMLSEFGIHVSHQNFNAFVIDGNQKYISTDTFIESDFSQAAFFLVANYLGNDVTLKGLNLDSKQSDAVIMDYIDTLKSSDEPLTFDGSNCPDIIPVFALACCFYNHPVTIQNIRRLRIKESDRLHTTVKTLNDLGAHLYEYDSHIEVMPIQHLNGNVTLSSYNDHRIAMMIAIASTMCHAPVTIEDSHSVNKSYPSFWEDFVILGGKVT